MAAPFFAPVFGVPAVHELLDLIRRALAGEDVSAELEVMKDKVGKIDITATSPVIDPLKPPRFVKTHKIKDPELDELLPLMIILAQRYPHVQQFYANLFKFMADLAKAGGSTWVGQWMSFKLLCMVMERFGLLWLGGAASYDVGLSWAFGTIAVTEFISDIAVGSITYGDDRTTYFGLGEPPTIPKKKK